MDDQAGGLHARRPPQGARDGAKDGIRLVPIVVYVQRIVYLIREGGSGQLLTLYIEANFAGKKYETWRKMLSQAYEMRALIVLIDGVDEAAGLRDEIEAFIHNELVPSGNRVLVTSRPEGVTLSLYKARFVIMNLNELTNEQQRAVINIQMQGSIFFDHLLSLGEVRKQLDDAYDKLRTRCRTSSRRSTRPTASSPRARPRARRQYDPEQRREDRHATGERGPPGKTWMIGEPPRWSLTPPPPTSPRPARDRHAAASASAVCGADRRRPQGAVGGPAASRRGGSPRRAPRPDTLFAKRTRSAGGGSAGSPRPLATSARWTRRRPQGGDGQDGGASRCWRKIVAAVATGAVQPSRRRSEARDDRGDDGGRRTDRSAGDARPTRRAARAQGCDRRTRRRRRSWRSRTKKGAKKKPAGRRARRGAGGDDVGRARWRAPTKCAGGRVGHADGREGQHELDRRGADLRTGFASSRAREAVARARALRKRARTCARGVRDADAGADDGAAAGGVSSSSSASPAGRCRMADERRATSSRRLCDSSGVERATARTGGGGRARRRETLPRLLLGVRAAVGKAMEEATTWTTRTWRPLELMHARQQASPTSTRRTSARTWRTLKSNFRASRLLRARGALLEIIARRPRRQRRTSVRALQLLPHAARGARCPRSSSTRCSRRSSSSSSTRPASPCCSRCSSSSSPRAARTSPSCRPTASSSTSSASSRRSASGCSAAAGRRAAAVGR